MTVQTYSIIAGSEACNARCPFCISKMTPTHDLGEKLQQVNWRNFDIGAKFARQNGASTVLITGKGEPTLFPDQISDYLKHLKKHDFPFIELQTNGIALAKQKERYASYLKEWYDAGMTTIMLSIVHYDSKKNKEIYQPDARNYFELTDLIEDLHGYGFSVRLSCIMAKEYIDNMDGIEKLVEYAKENKVEQLSVRSIDRPEYSENDTILKWVDEHMIEDSTINDIRDHLDKNGTRLRELVHGAIVYDYKGQNICLSNCLTHDAKNDDIRHVIFYPDGHIRYDWQYKGAILV